MTEKEAKAWMRQIDCRGWLTLITAAYKQLPAHLEIVQVYQKWALLGIDYNGKDDQFEAFLETLVERSAHSCERCGATNSQQVTANGWEHTLCYNHYQQAPPPKYSEAWDD